MKKSLLTLLSLLILLSSLTALAPTPSLAQGQLQEIACNTVFDEDTCKLIDNIFSNQGQGPWYAQTPSQFSTRVFKSPENEIFGERYTYAQINWIINTLLVTLNPALGASSTQDLLSLFTIIQKASDQSKQILEQGNMMTPAEYARLGPFGIAAGLINALYQHPIASGKVEVQNSLSLLQIVSPAHAQGTGYTFLGLGTVRALWTMTRNMAYLITIILLVSAGFMVMFRSKINPQVAVTVQMIIPKLAIALVLITFSYAIVGLVIDMIYVFIAAFMGFLALPGGVINPINLATNITSLTTAGISAIPLWLVSIPIVLAVIGILIMNVMALVGGWGWIFWIAAAIVGLTVWAILTTIRLIIVIFSAYFNLILLTISGPLQIMFDVVPFSDQSRGRGLNLGFYPWFMCVLGNASVFCTVAVMVTLIIILTGLGQSGLSQWFSGLFNIPATPLFTVTGIVPGFNLPFVNFGQGGFIWVWIIRWLIGMGIFQAIPAIANNIRQALCKWGDYSPGVSKVLEDWVNARASAKYRQLTTKERE